jgi:hypothetical protein
MDRQRSKRLSKPTGRNPWVFDYKPTGGSPVGFCYFTCHEKIFVLGIPVAGAILVRWVKDHDGANWRKAAAAMERQKRPDRSGQRGAGMDALRELLDDLKRHGLDQGNWLGLLNLVIGRRLEKADGTVISRGLTWRELAALLKKLRWDRDAVREVGLNPDDLPPRDRQQYWYSAIARAHVDSDEATRQGDRLAEKIQELGYRVGPGPRR